MPRGNAYTRFSCANILNNFHNDSDHPSTSRCSSSHVHMSSSIKSKLKQPEEALTTEETPIEVKVSPWPRRRRIVCHFFLCNAKSFGIWVLITFLSCLVYASIVYGSLVNRDIFRRSKNTIPGYHHPLQYNITLRFAANYHDAHNLSFSGQTQLLFEPTVLTPNFVMNIGPNVKINQIYFQRVPDGTFLRASKTGQDKKAQTISYVISFMFEPGRRYLAVIDYSGQLYPPANQRETPRLVLFKQNKKQSYAIVHINPSDSTEGLRFVTPSLDYDTFTARFALNIERHTGYNSISNMPIEQSIYHISDKLGEDMFPPTIPIRPSQLAFVVSNLNSTTVFDCGTPEPPPMPLRVNFVSSEVKDVGHFFGALTDRLGSSDAMGFPKLDGVILPKVESADQPGISVINDHDARKSAALALNGRYRTQYVVESAIHPRAIASTTSPIRQSPDHQAKNSRPKRLSTYNPYWTGSTDSEDGPTIYIGDSDEEAVVTYPPNWPRRTPADPDYDADGEDAAMPETRRRMFKKKVISFKFAAPIYRTASSSVNVGQAVMGDVASISNPYLAAWVSDVCDVYMSDGNNLEVNVQSNCDYPIEPSNSENASAIAVPILETEAVMSLAKESAAPSSPIHVHKSETVMSETPLKPLFDDNGPDTADAMDVPDYQWIEAIDTCLDVDASDEFPAPPPILTAEVDNQGALFKDYDKMDYEANANTDAKPDHPGTTVQQNLAKGGAENVPPMLAHFKDPMLDFVDPAKTTGVESIFAKPDVKRRRIMPPKPKQKAPVSIFNRDVNAVGHRDSGTRPSLFMNWINAPIIRTQPCPYLPTKDAGPLDDPMN